MQLNDRAITKEFCEDARKAGIRLYFSPVTRQEAEFIQEKLFSFGYRWDTKGRSLRSETPLLREGFFLGLNGTLLTGAPGADSGLFCRAEQLEEGFLSDEHAAMMKEMREMQKSFMTEIAALKAEVLALRSEISPSMEKPVRLPGSADFKKDSKM